MFKKFKKKVFKIDISNFDSVIVDYGAVETENDVFSGLLIWTNPFLANISFMPKDKF